MLVQTQAVEHLRRWQADPRLFVREALGVTPDPWQDDVLLAAATNMRLAMCACKGPGKSCVLAWIIIWWFCVWPEPKGAAVSVNGDNLRDGLWAELARWIQGSRVASAVLNWTKTQIQVRGKDHCFFSFKTWSRDADDTQQANSVAGLHAPYPIFIIDEAGGVPMKVYTAAEAVLASGIRKLLGLAGNPTCLDGPLYHACRVNPTKWHITYITGDPDDPKRSPRVDIEWARNLIQEFGRDDPWVLVNVFGQFPPASITGLLSLEDVRAATLRHLDEAVYRNFQKRVGVDVAYTGMDKSVIFPRQGLLASRPLGLREPDPANIAMHAGRVARDFGAELVTVDDTGGFGSGVVSAMRTMGYDPLPVNFSSRANDRNHYANARAEMWHRMAQWVKQGGSLPDVDGMARELTAAEYTFDSRGRMIIIPKEQMKRLIGASPDNADALALTFRLPEAMATSFEQAAWRDTHRQGLVNDWDPFALTSD